MDHIPVMTEEVMNGLAITAEGTYWDGTFGNGGHSALILEQLGEAGFLYASDRDGRAERIAAQGFADRANFRFLRGNLDQVCDQIAPPWSGFLWDLGVSSPQLRDSERGFSFTAAGPLDMRMDDRQEEQASDLVNRLPEKALADLIYKYGEERLSRRIAARIVAARAESPIEDTQTLAEICRRSYPRKYHRIDPATRTFQALRIAVNDELGELERALPRALERLGQGGRAVIISFHSLEDRIVKHCFRDHEKRGGYRVLTKKPQIAGAAEVAGNPAARSAKLRVLMRC